MRLIALTFLTVALGGSISAAEFEISNGIAAIANDAVITHQDVLQDCEEVIATYQRTYFNNPQVYEQKRLAARDRSSGGAGSLERTRTRHGSPRL